MAEQFGRHMERRAVRYCRRGEAVPQVMQPDALDTGAFERERPSVLKRPQMRAAPAAKKYVII
jgi:hypothetical protein